VGAVLITTKSEQVKIWWTFHQLRHSSWLALWKLFTQRPHSV